MLAALGKRSDAEFVMRVVHTMRRALELAELDWEMVEHTAAAVTLEFSSSARIQFTVEQYRSLCDMSDVHIASAHATARAIVLTLWRPSWCASTRPPAREEFAFGTYRHVDAQVPLPERMFPDERALVERAIHCISNIAAVQRVPTLRIDMEAPEPQLRFGGLDSLPMEALLKLERVFCSRVRTVCVEITPAHGLRTLLVLQRDTDARPKSRKRGRVAEVVMRAFTRARYGDE